MSEALLTIEVTRATGSVVEGEALVSAEGFSPRYDLDRWSGVITKPGHKLEGLNIRDKILFLSDGQRRHRGGLGVLRHHGKGIRAESAFVFGVTNPVMVQGAVFADIPITEGWSRDPLECIQSGDIVRVDPARKTIELLRRKQS